VARRRVLPLVLVALGSPPVAAAPKLFVELNYQTDAALERCPTEADFRAMISAQLAYDPFAEPSQQRVVARAEASEPGIRGVVEWYDASGAFRGQRELDSESRDCPSFMRALSFALAVQIQLLAEEEAAAGAPSSEAAKTPAPPVAKSAPAPATARKPSDEGSNAWQWLVGAGPALAFGVAPRMAIQAHVFTQARYDALGVELGGEASVPTRHELDGGEGFEQWTAAGSLSGCGFFRPLSGCLVSQVGTLQVRGFGVDEPRSDSGLVAQVGLRLGLEHGFGRHWVGALRLEARAALISWEIQLNDREAWRTPPFSLTVGADWAALFR
jgi:hypothetical protein